MEAKVKILKVAILKLKKKNRTGREPEEDYSFFGEKPVNARTETAKPATAKLEGKINLKRSSKQSQMSTSTTDTLSNESLLQELRSLKSQWVEKEQEYKIQISRMKVFYDKHLNELNLSKLNKSHPAKVTEHISIPTDNEKVLKDVRAKNLKQETKIRELEFELKDRDLKINDLRNRIANQGHTKLSKMIEDLKAEKLVLLQVIQQKEAEMQKIDTLEYQLESKHSSDGPAIKLVVQSYLKIKKAIATDSLAKE